MLSGAGADIFDGGSDRIMDFDRAEDRLTLETMLWNNDVLVSGDVVFLFARTDGIDTVFDFGGGNTLTLTGVGDLTGLGDRIDYI